VQILCGTQDPHDPAIAVVKEIAGEFPDRMIDLHVLPRVNGSNLKISNVVNMVERASHDVLILVDSDIEVAPDYTCRIIAELQRPDVGAVTCLYYGVARGGAWARLAAMGINLHFLPNVIFALAFNLARPCFGATIAVSRDTLRRIGGFGAFVEQLWDDYAIGEAVRALGLKVAVPPFALGHVCTEGSSRELLTNQLRHARTIRSIDPLGYAGSIITHPLPLALASWLCGGGSGALVLAAAALACRAVLYASIEHRFGQNANDYWLLPLHDLLSFAVYVASFCGATVVWRGQRYRIAPGGTIMPSSNEK
jgi:ceramide glucosyltransferase